MSVTSCSWHAKLLMATLVVGCGGENSDERESSTQYQAPIRAANSSSLGTYEGAPVVQRAGANAPVIWRPSGQAAVRPEAELSHSTSRIVLRELRADANWLYIDLIHEEGGDSSDKGHESAPVEISVRANECLVPAPRASGSLPRDWGNPSTLVVSLTSLPEGELVIGARSHGVETTFLLAKEGKAVRSITYDQLSAVRRVPADPANGLPESIVYRQESPCANAEAPL